MSHALDQLRSADPRARASMCRALVERPSTDPAVLSACEALLEDRTITLLAIPYRFGEVRAVAAEAVWALRVALGIREPVVLHEALPVCSTNDVGNLARAAGTAIEGHGVEGVIATLTRLDAAGAVRRRTLTLNTVPDAP